MPDRIDELIKRQNDAVTAYTEVFMDDVLGEAQRRAPKDEGTLRASAGRRTVPLSGKGATVIGYFATPYARAQHERTDYRHAHGEAHYLSGPFGEMYPEWQDGVARVVRAVNGGASS